MASSLSTGFCVSGYNDTILSSFGVSPSVGALQFSHSRSKEFMGKPLVVLDQRSFLNLNARASGITPVKAQASIYVSKSIRWWEKNLPPNMIEIKSAQELVDTLSNAGDRLAIIDFYSPGCGGCRTVHPKICQLAEKNPDAIVLKVNYEELKPMCHILHIHVLPFFRFYRGAEGRLCSFSCTIATIKKYKDALAKYGTEEWTSGPAKGLDEKELSALASAGLISRALPLEHTMKEKTEELVCQGLDLTSTLSKDENITGVKESNALVMA